MARKRKSRSKDRASPNKAVKGTGDVGETSTTRKRGKEAASKKRKTVSETPRRSKRSKTFKKVKSSSSIELIRVLPCCSSDQERKKYAKLGLDSALFLSSSKPGKRKQSHISVITISSSDDEEVNNDKTAEWISKMDIETINISSTEEPFPSGDADFSQNNSMVEEMIDVENFRPKKSSTQICSTPESSFKPLCASTPQERLFFSQPPCFSTTDESNQTYKGPSFLENPVKNLRQYLTNLQLTGSPHTVTSANQNQRDYEHKVKSDFTSRSCSPKFYFGPSQNFESLHQIFENSEPTAPVWSDLSCFNTRHPSNTNANAYGEEFGKQETEARRYSLEQVASTSHAPLSEPVLEVAPKKKRSKSRNTSNSKK